MTRVAADDRANGRPAPHAVEDPTVQTTDALPRNVHRLLLWTAGAVVVAVCIAAFLLWGIYGPTYLFDLIAAYCG